MLILVSSLPNAFVATHVKRAESVLSVLFILKSDNTPFGNISSRIVYLVNNESLSRLVTHQILALFINMKYDLISKGEVRDI